MIVVLGANGFVGSNVYRSIKEIYVCKVVPVDKEITLSSRNYLLDDVSSLIVSGELPEFIKHNNGVISHVVIMSGNSNTLGGEYYSLMEDNYEYPKRIIDLCLLYGIGVIYASSASVYKYQYKGTFRKELPINDYARSKFALDEYVKNKIDRREKVYGLRLFNVYGPNEEHKGNMSSMIYKLTNQYLNTGFMSVFGETDGYKSGEQKRDFISVDRVANVVIDFLSNDYKSGIYDVGTGVPISFNDIASLVYYTANSLPYNELNSSELVENGVLRYTEISSEIRSYFQSYTCAVVDGVCHKHTTRSDSIYDISRHIEWLIEKSITNAFERDIPPQRSICA